MIGKSALSTIWPSGVKAESPEGSREARTAVPIKRVGKQNWVVFSETTTEV